MKMYLIQIIYFDDKDVRLEVEEPQVPSVLEALRDNKPYWNENKTYAIWTPSTEIRYVNIIEYKPPVKEEVKQP
jgi:hypothetical protein